MTDPQVWIPLLSVGGAFLLWVTRLLWRVGALLAQHIRDYNGTPARPGVPRQLGVMERLEQQGEQLDTLLEAVQPLPGMAAQLGRVDAQTLETERLARDTARLAQDLSVRVSALERGDPPPQVSLFRK